MKQAKFEFKDTAEPSYRSARRIVPTVVGLIGVPASVVDLGGGCGGWLKAFREAGANRIRCVDHTSVGRQDLLIDYEDFVPCDLDSGMPEPIPSDVAMSIEFAEHMSKDRAKEIVQWLCASASCILFSAAIPRQVGLGHINEQWPDYWQDLFAEAGFRQFDAVRPAIVFDSEILPWLRQNLFLYAKEGSPVASRLAYNTRPIVPNDFEIIEKRTLHRAPTLSEVLKEFPRALRLAIGNRIGRPEISKACRSVRSLL